MLFQFCDQQPMTLLSRSMHDIKKWKWNRKKIKTETYTAEKPICHVKMIDNCRDGWWTDDSSQKEEENPDITNLKK